MKTRFDAPSSLGYKKAMNAGAALGGVLALIVLLMSNLLPYRIVSAERVEALEARVRSLEAAAAAAATPAPAPEAAPEQPGAWMWQRSPHALNRGAYGEKKNVASAPLIY